MIFRISYANNLQFQLKLVAIAIAGINMMWFHTNAYRRISEWNQEATPPAAARYAGMASLMVWTATIFLGRWIGFTLEVLF